jgi:hypothetical protein
MTVPTQTPEPSAARDRESGQAVRFCSRCGRLGEDPAGRPELRRRVCGRCGMGVMLSSLADALPGPAAPFLVVTSDGVIGAVSLAGDKLFGSERDLLGTPLLELLSCPLGDRQLERLVRRAAHRRAETVALPVRLVPEEAPRVGTLSARIGTCASPRAALVAVEPSGFAIR